MMRAGPWATPEHPGAPTQHVAGLGRLHRGRALRAQRRQRRHALVALDEVGRLELGQVVPGRLALFAARWPRGGVGQKASSSSFVSMKICFGSRRWPAAVMPPAQLEQRHAHLVDRLDAVRLAPLPPRQEASGRGLRGVQRGDGLVVARQRGHRFSGRRVTIGPHRAVADRPGCRRRPPRACGR